MAILESAANTMLMNVPKQMAMPPQNEESIIELMGRECVRQFFEVLRINPNLCRVFYDPQVSFHYHKIASQTDFASDGLYMFSGKESVVRALHDLDFVDSSIDLLLVRSLEVNLPSLFSSISNGSNKDAYESSPAASAETKHLLSTSVHGVLQTKSLGHYRIFMTMTTLVTGGHFKILTQSLVLWELSVGPTSLGGVVLPSGASYDYETIAAAAAAFGLQAAQAPFMSPPSQHQHLMLNQFQAPVNNVPNAAADDMLRHQQQPEANVETFDNADYTNTSSLNDTHSQQHRPSGPAAADMAAAEQQRGNSTSDSQTAAAQSNNRDINNSALIVNNSKIVSPHMPLNSTPPEFVTSSSSQSPSTTVGPSSADFGQSASIQQQHHVGTTPADSQYATVAAPRDTASAERQQPVDEQQQHDPYSNFKQQHLQQLNSSNDEGYASSLQNADVNGDTSATPTNSVQYVSNTASVGSQPPATGANQMLSQQAYNSTMMPMHYATVVNGPASQQPMKAYSAVFSNAVSQQNTQPPLPMAPPPLPMAPPPLSYGASLQQHSSDMLSNGGMSVYDQQPPAFRNFYSSDQQHGGYNSGNYRGNRGGNFNSRGGGYNRSYNRDGNFRGGRGGGDRNFGNDRGNNGGNRNRNDGGPFGGRNYNSNSSYADQQQSTGGNSYNVYNNNSAQRGGRKGGPDQSSAATTNSGDYRSSQPLPSTQQSSAGAAVPLSNNMNGAGGSPSSNNRQSNAAAVAAGGGGVRPSR